MRLKKLHPILHLLCGKEFPDKGKAINDVANGTALLPAVGDARMPNACGVEAEEVVVLGEDDTPLGESEGHMPFVGGLEESCVSRGGYVDTSVA